jgi:hypothetical protein
MDIDFVITWVDMDDPKWQAEFAKYSDKKENTKNGVSKARFRDYGFLKYWFRGVEKFAPWVRKIHFVTSGQKPEWLDASNPKINLVNHKDYIPEEFLPTYNSVVIERYIHKIPGLAEHFVYFNDDFYIINKISTERFFKNGLPCDIAVFQYNRADAMKGFSWEETIEGHDFWNYVIAKKRFDVFFERYAKSKEVYIRGREDLRNGENVIRELESRGGINTWDKMGCGNNALYFIDPVTNYIESAVDPQYKNLLMSNYTEISPGEYIMVELSIQEIAEKLGIDVNKLRIKK